MPLQLALRPDGERGRQHARRVRARLHDAVSSPDAGADRASDARPVALPDAPSDAPPDAPPAAAGHAVAAPDDEAVPPVAAPDDEAVPPIAGSDEEADASVGQANSGTGSALDIDAVEPAGADVRADPPALENPHRPVVIFVVVFWMDDFR